jgi:hypothetical protein
LFVGLNHVSRDILNQTLVIAVIDARRDPRQRLPNRSLLIGLRFCEPLSCNLDIEISRVGELQDSREVDAMTAANARGRPFPGRGCRIRENQRNRDGARGVQVHHFFAGTFTITG